MVDVNRTIGYVKQRISLRPDHAWVMGEHAHAVIDAFQRDLDCPVSVDQTATGTDFWMAEVAGLQMGIGQVIMVLCSGFAFYAFIRNFVPPWIAAAGSLLYCFAPYHFAVDLLVRQSIGEITAFIWLPLVLLAVDRLAASRAALPSGTLSRAQS